MALIKVKNDDDASKMLEASRLFAGSKLSIRIVKKKQKQTISEKNDVFHVGMLRNSDKSVTVSQLTKVIGQFGELDHLWFSPEVENPFAGFCFKKDSDFDSLLAHHKEVEEIVLAGKTISLTKSEFQLSRKDHIVKFWDHKVQTGMTKPSEVSNDGPKQTF